MKFFKYLIFLFLTLFSTFTLAITYKFNGKLYKSAEAVCAAALGTSQPYTCSVYNKDTLNAYFKFTYTALNQSGTFSAEFTDDKCEPGTKRFLDGYITPSIENGGSPPDQVCFLGCIYKSDGGGTSFPTPNGNENWGFNAETTGATCDVDTPKGEDKPTVPVDPNMKPEECKNASGSNAYCDKPADKNCPTGYKQGMFNNKQICVKNSTDPDPTKPNPNDPNNNGDGKGNCNGTNNCNTTNFDDSKIIEAINASTSAITNAISSLSSTITNGFNSLASSINSISSSINANGDKVTNAVNANGDKVTNAVNAGTNATKENGKKLDGIKDAVGEGNGFLKDIKNWLFADVDQNSFNAETPMRDLQQKDIESDKYKVSGQCPVSRTFSFKGHTFTLDLSNFCYVLEIMGIIVGIAACLHGVAILSENT